MYTELETALSSKAILTFKPLSACVLIKENLPALRQGPTQTSEPKCQLSCFQRGLGAA